MSERYQDIKLPWSGWKITGWLGKGSYGHVYKIKRKIGESIEEDALKVISIPSDSSEIESDYSEGYTRESIHEKYEAYKRDIEKEYGLMCKMKGCANIVSCSDYASVPHDDGIGWDVFIRMELLKPLTKLLMEKELSSEEIRKLGMDLCSALVWCEKEKIVHRDIKPQNILVTKDGNYKLGDFGVAKTMDHTTYATKAGTEPYMAPEVIKGEAYGKAADIYSLGLVLYWLLNGRRLPFLPVKKEPPTISEKNLAYAKRIKGEPFPEPSSGGQKLKEVVLKACAYQPRDRYASAESMLEALRSAGTSVELEAERKAPKPDGNTSEQDSSQESGDNSWSDDLGTIVVSNEEKSDSDDNPTQGKTYRREGQNRSEVQEPSGGTGGQESKTNQINQNTLGGKRTKTVTLMPDISSQATSKRKFFERKRFWVIMAVIGLILIARYYSEKEKIRNPKRGNVLEGIDLYLLMNFPAVDSIDEVTEWLDENQYEYTTGTSYIHVEDNSASWEVQIDTSGYNGENEVNGACNENDERIEFQLRGDDSTKLVETYQTIIAAFDQWGDRIYENEFYEGKGVETDHIEWEYASKRIEIRIYYATTSITVTRSDIGAYDWSSFVLDTTLISEIPLDTMENAVAWLTEKNYQYEIVDDKIQIYSDNKTMWTADFLSEKIYIHIDGNNAKEGIALIDADIEQALGVKEKRDGDYWCEWILDNRTIATFMDDDSLLISVWRWDEKWAE